MKKCEQGESLTARLDKRVEIQTLSDSRDSYGAPSLSLTTLVTVWAAVEPLQGREFFAAIAEQAEVTTRIRIRYRPGIDRTMVVKHRGIVYEILYIIEPERDKVELQLMCKERQ